jgi:hypothetical protein
METAGQRILGRTPPPQSSLYLVVLYPWACVRTSCTQIFNRPAVSSKHAFLPFYKSKGTRLNRHKVTEISYKEDKQINKGTRKFKALPKLRKQDQMTGAPRRGPQKGSDAPNTVVETARSRVSLPLLLIERTSHV